MFRLVVFCSLALWVPALWAQPQRPLRHADYDAWRSISSPKLSDDGQYLIYGLFPQKGDGEAVIRHLPSKREIRVPAGQRPEPPAADFSGAEEAPPLPPSINPVFSADGAWVALTVFPTRAELEQARKEKKKPADMPKNGLALVRLANGEISRVTAVKSFQLPADAGAAVAYLRHDSTLVLKPLDAGAERTWPDVAEYRLTDDGQLLVFAAKGGVNAVATTPGAAPQLILGAPGKFAKLTADANQQRFAFLKDTQLYSWDRGTPSAKLVADPVASGASLTFADDGSRLFFGLPAPVPSAAEASSEEAAFDLWHYRDDFIQPMQRVRARRDRDRSFRAAYDFASGKTMPLGSESLPQVVTSRDGKIAYGYDDRAYRTRVDYDPGRYQDVYAVDVATGARRLAVKQVSGTPQLSPDGRYLVFFRDRHWHAFDYQSGEIRNLTVIAGRNFHDEEHDAPSPAPAYGTPAFTRDSRSVLIADRFDLWHVALDGSIVRNVTDGLGRKENIELRLVILNPDPKVPGIDPAAPLLLRARRQETKDTGFYRDSLDPAQMPERLVMAPLSYSAPVKAKKADVVVTTAQSFTVAPDLQATTMAMKTFERVSDANPQRREFAWGSAEQITYRNADGVPLSALLVKPANFDPAKKYPLMVYIYERLSQNLHEFVAPAPSHRINASYYASNGYVVLMPDIAYTIGYPGASALKCVVPATQKVIDMGFIDPARVGIQGHSWGGYQIAYMITQTNLFRAAAPGALVANMISAYDGIRWGPGLPRQFQYEKTQSRIGGTPWEYPMRFIENSPIFMADRIQTPVLMLHNDADDAVPWYQGIEFFLALRRLNKEVYFFNYNGEPHGLRKRANQMDYTVRLQEFFDHYLKGASKPLWMEKGRPYLEKPGAVAAGAAASDHDR